ncbi:protein N-lysine methyltransferase METTL21A-like isoform X1 [Zingiber officinale]|uniref:protein N-lysine methyltransferase METTL21A-like isoform X1 n=2 Tax=Zingiber officinale TaxID=94328 RepID=UPI001C4C6B49|nr:protein N-lysine methyltransferase METTL21A-like isoform X1 [Zingiber officinale]
MGFAVFLPLLLFRCRLKRQLCWSAAATDSSRVCHAICAMEESDDDTICLGDSIFVNRDYELTTFTFGRHSLRLLCLRSASTDYDLTGQVVWPGAVLLNNYLTENAGMLHGCSIIELGSGIGITGILCSRFCREIVLTDHNVEVLEIIRKNIELQSSLDDPCSAGLSALKLEWGNSDQLSKILQEHPAGFDLVLGADICFQQSSIPPLFNTVEKLLLFRGGKCKFILAYVSRAKNMDAMIVDEALKHGMQISEVQGTRSVVANLEGVIFEITMQSS